MIDKKQYTLNVLEEIATLLNHFYLVEYKFYDYVEMQFNGKDMLYINDKQRPEFNFKVAVRPEVKGEKAIFVVSIVPGSATSNIKVDRHLSLEEVYVQFESWVAIIIKFESIILSKEQFYSKQSEQEFYEEFQIPVDESSLKALPLENQHKAILLLEELQKKLAKDAESNPQIKEIIEDAQVLKDNIQNLPQSVVARRVAKLQVKIKKIGVKFFFDVIDIVYKEAIKFALQGGAPRWRAFISTRAKWYCVCNAYE